MTNVVVLNVLSALGLIVIGGGFIAGFVYVWIKGDNL